jgi:hypothetical protein
LLQVKVVPLRSVTGPDLSLSLDPDWRLASVGVGVFAAVVEGTTPCLMRPGHTAFEVLSGAPARVAVITGLEDPRRCSLSHQGHTTAPMPRSGHTDGNFMGVAVGSKDGWRRPALVRHPGGGKRLGHNGFQIALSSSRSLGVEAPLRKVKPTA